MTPDLPQGIPPDVRTRPRLLPGPIGRRAVAGAVGAVPFGSATAIGMGASPLPCLLITAAAALVTIVIVAVVTVILSMQHTRRQQIEYHGVNVIADAVADCIHAAYRGAAPHAGSQEQAEAAASRAAASQLLTSPASPTILIRAALAQPKHLIDDTGTSS